MHDTLMPAPQLLDEDACPVGLQGTINLIDAAKAQGVAHFVLLSSLLTNAAAVGQKNNPNYKFLNLFGGVLDRKLVSASHMVLMLITLQMLPCMPG